MATEHDNDVQFRLNGIQIQSFEVTDHSITGGQPYDGATVVHGDKIRVKAGRKGCDTVAKWFKAKAGNGMVVACDTFVSYPSKLNFAIYGTFTFGFAGKVYVVNDMLLAQGKNARSENNWWVGGPYMEGGSAEPFVGAAVTSAKKGILPIAKIGFIAPPASISHFLMTVVSL